MTSPVNPTSSPDRPVDSLSQIIKALRQEIERLEEAIGLVEARCITVAVDPKRPLSENALPSFNSPASPAAVELQGLYSNLAGLRIRLNHLYGALDLPDGGLLR